MTDRKLVLYPADPESGADVDTLETALLQVAFIGRPVDAAEGKRFRPGERFVELLRFDPPRPAQRYTVAVSEQRDEVDFLGGSNVKAPSCPCGTVFHDWNERVDAWRETKSDWHCGGCGTDAQPWAFDWGRSAGFGRCNVDIHGVELGDAVPSDDLLRSLGDASGSRWDYFYFAE